MECWYLNKVLFPVPQLLDVAQLLDIGTLALIGGNRGGDAFFATIRKDSRLGDAGTFHDAGRTSLRQIKESVSPVWANSRPGFGKGPRPYLLREG